MRRNWPTWLPHAVAHDDGPIAFRFPRGDGVGIDLPSRGTPLAIGKARLVRDGNRVALLSFGTPAG